MIKFIKQLIVAYNRLNRFIPRHLQIAFDELGETEVRGVRSNSRIIEYLSTCDMRPDSDEIAWCSAFVNWVIISDGKIGTDNLLARSWLNWGKTIVKPRLGCVAIMKRGTKEWQGHVGFYLDSNNGVVFILGGNQSDRVGVNGYKEDSILGYRWFKEESINIRS